MWIKICGICNEQDLEAALLATPDALGFIYGNKDFSRDALSLDQIEKLARLVPAEVEAVLVTGLCSRKEIKRLLEESGCQTAQVGPRIAGDPGWIQTVEIGKNVPPLSGRILLETGRSGKAEAWPEVAALCAASNAFSILAGGLCPDNVQEAIAATGVHGVDANSGLDDAGGQKSAELCRQFAERARLLKHML